MRQRTSGLDDHVVGVFAVEDVGRVHVGSIIDVALREGCHDEVAEAQGKVDHSVFELQDFCYIVVHIAY